MATLFERKAPKIVGDLVRDLRLKDFQAAGFVGNFGAETGGFTLMQEVKPVVPGSRGGYGWAQWTGPRRRAFEAWAKDNGLDVKSDAANYGFLLHELRGSESAALAAVRKAVDVTDAAVIVETKFERPGVSARNKRINYAKIALNAYRASMSDVPPPDIEPIPDDKPKKPLPKPRPTLWATIGAAISSAIGSLSDWKIAAVIAVAVLIGIAAYMIIHRRQS